jgi:dipeptidyl aminopeptidase/acylaminoacyl peptidase
MKKAMLVLTAYLFILSALPAGAQTRPLTFDDFIKIKRVTDPQPSPDGSWIAFVVTAMDKEANRGNSDIWLIPAKGGEPRQLTSGPLADMNPRWSPDGRKIAFISTRSGLPQVWLINPAGGEAYQLTTLSTGASGVIWSPDGKFLAFTSSVYPDCPDDDCNKKKAEAREKSKVKAGLYGHLLVRHWNAWADGTRSHVFIVPAEGGKAVDATPGDYDTPPIALGASQDYAFSPDGSELCFVRNIDAELKLGLGTNNDLFLTSVKGGEIKSLTTNKADDNSPRYSPDGKYIAYKAMARPGFEADKYSLMLYDRKTQKIQNLTERLDDSVDEISWARDGSAIYFSAEEKGRNAAAGASYGGYMVDWIEGQTDAFKCLVSHSGVFDLRSMYGATEELWFPEWEYLGTPWTSPEQYAKWSPSSHVKNFKTPCLVIHSQNDFRVPLEQGLQFFTALQRMNVPSKLLYFPDEDHFIQKPQNAELWWKTVLDWLAEYLKK